MLHGLISLPKLPRNLLRTICWVNSNLGRYKNLTDEEIMLVMSLGKAGLYSEDEDIMSDSLWAIAYVTDTHDDSLIETISEPELLTTVV